MALDLSGFNVILLAQNPACSDSKQDSRAECMRNHARRRHGNIELCIIGDDSAYCCCMPRAVQCVHLESYRWRIIEDRGQSLGEHQRDRWRG